MLPLAFVLAAVALALAVGKASSFALVATVVSLSVAGTQSGPVSADSVGQASTVQPPVVPGSGTAYLGAFVDPDGNALSAGDPTGGVLSLEAELGSLPLTPGPGPRPLWA